MGVRKENREKQYDACAGKNHRKEEQDDAEEDVGAAEVAIRFLLHELALRFG
ncbi:MAG TPA: hypothetical protein VKX25_05475 [Bryobacteraceae bacterium]|jgi:hypothetical protein|nr:hypothetical protein [Bryobacteraceae bacterium]